jgi:imidazoleglycerol phosphate synthase glutamine amidotransferase subunit HisH
VIAIFDYGAGNLRSVANTLDEIGAEYRLVSDAGGLRAASKIVRPGVGHFGQMMRALDELGVRETLVERIRAGVPFVGIASPANPRREELVTVLRDTGAVAVLDDINGLEGVLET